MPSDKRKSKAAITIDIQSNNETVADTIVSLRNTAESLLESAVPSKRQKKQLLDTA